MSIPSRPLTFRLPDFRNQGVWLRLLLAANGLMLAFVLIGNRSLALLPQELVELAALVEPILLLVLSLLFLLSARLQRLPAHLAGALVVILAVVVASAVDFTLAYMLGSRGGWRVALAAGASAIMLLAWFSLWLRAQEPALAEARMSALTARIRPHFLYNSLNAVLGVMREDPRRAELALEELAELFRALMRDNRELMPLSDDIALARKYLEIERLRLGERLQVRWAVEDCPADALSPPLLLQPLLENAVHHGIEPAATPGEIQVCIATVRDGVRIEVENPWLGEDAARPGNRMALDNLRERLMLFYDLEARLDTGIKGDRYRVRVELPIRKPA